MNGLYSGNYVENQAKTVACADYEAGQLRTVRENIDIKIAALQNEIKRLEESKESLSPLMDMRIRDIREAMSF